MTPQDVDRNDPRRISFESACREYWIAFVRTETGERAGDGTHAHQRRSNACSETERLDREIKASLQMLLSGIRRIWLAKRSLMTQSGHS